MSHYSLRLPDSLMSIARKIAKKENASMNQLFVSAIAEKLSALETQSLLKKRAKEADLDAYLNVLSRVPDHSVENEEDRLNH